ncbi:MAG TPA: helix-turn-helix domain-containing protein, partial [Candidatus Methylomirabilis sp.]|nr:helix-turn-helix domain-containing protein [Candidatus Methylomirabilis sp.]
GPVVTPEDLPPNIRAPIGPSPGSTQGSASLSEMERVHIARVLSETGGKKMKAARLLGIDIKTLNQKIKRYNIPR